MNNLYQVSFTELLNSNAKKVALDSDNAILLSDSPKDESPKLNRSSLGRAWDWATSKGVIRVFNVAMPALAFGGIGALSGGIVPIVGVSLAAAAVTYSAVRDTRSLRILKELEKEHNLVQEYHLAKNLAENANSVLEKKTGLKLISNMPDKTLSGSLKSHPFQRRYEKDLLKRSLGNTLRDSLFESGANIASVAVIAVSGLAGAAANAVSFGITALTLGVVDLVQSTSERKKMKLIKRDMVRNIRSVGADVPPYENIEQLSAIVREQKINAAAIKACAEQDWPKSFTEEDINKAIQLKRASLGIEQFPPDLRPSFWQRTKQYIRDFRDAHLPNAYYNSSRFAEKLDDEKKVRDRSYREMDSQVQELAHKKSKDVEQDVSTPGVIRSISQKSFIKLQKHTGSISV